MHQNLAIILQQINYGKNSFIVLVPGLKNVVNNVAQNDESIFLKKVNL